MPDDHSSTPDRTNRDNHAADKPAFVIEREILERRIAAENAHYEHGFPVAGHDFRREEYERERGR
ncbi:hypothetical protein P7D22_11540 [Lichenihabitans sp. Uapishka_5]|uniref:hypothetical protein n=1 Tax=Lichenihabitans sp. Uapishka_5 TaxID=3037302 RepID=UPI0029E80BF2|nr:hypothetical protein [Lichenihabitans sp. Uapishka_5]MDX7951802.1 hypothetical protein [Lichenihabitans sp. Uapishka_5]